MRDSLNKIKLYFYGTGIVGLESCMWGGASDNFGQIDSKVEIDRDCFYESAMEVPCDGVT